MSLLSLHSRLWQSSVNRRLLCRYAPKGQVPRNDGIDIMHNILLPTDYTDIRSEMKDKILFVHRYNAAGSDKNRTTTAAIKKTSIVDTHISDVSPSGVHAG